MKNLSIKYLLLLSVAVLILFQSCDRPEPQDLVFFYFESCPSCDEYKIAEEYNEEIQLLNKSRNWNARHYNLISPEAGAELKKVIAEKGLPDISRSLPLLIIGDDYINGYDEIGKRLEIFLSEQ